MSENVYDYSKEIMAKVELLVNSAIITNDNGIQKTIIVSSNLWTVVCDIIKEKNLQDMLLNSMEKQE